MWLAALFSTLYLPRVACIHFREHVMVSHDTARLGVRVHPHNTQRKVAGYAFYHTNKNLLSEHFLPPTSKAVHFARSNYSSLSRNTEDTALRRKRSASHSAAQTTATSHTCGGPISPGAVWKTSHGFFINSKNSQMLTSRFLTASLEEALDTWKCVLSANNRMVLGPLLGVRNWLSGDSINVNDPDGENAVGVGTFSTKKDTIAVTIAWGVFGGPVNEQEIVEWKMVLNNHYRFGNSSATRGVIDCTSTFTHELGHALGLDDEYNPACSDATMYGSSVENETKKRSLAPADIYQIRKMYPKEN